MSRRPVTDVVARTPRSSDLWETPPDLVAACARWLGPFNLDPAATMDTAKAPAYYTPEDDGLARPWFGAVWLNPPYSRTGRWVAKAAEEWRAGRVERVVALVAARTDTRWWHDIVLPTAAMVVFLRGRVQFLLDGQPVGPAPFPSAIVVWQDRPIGPTPRVYGWDWQRSLFPH
jgi:phage N-6-adenine-methyltransferase